MLYIVCLTRKIVICHFHAWWNNAASMWDFSDGFVLDFQRSMNAASGPEVTLTSSVSLTCCTRTTLVPVGARDHETHVVHLPVSHLALGQLSWGVSGSSSRSRAVSMGRFLMFFSLLFSLLSLPLMALLSSHHQNHRHSRSHLIDPLVSYESRPSLSAVGSG